MEKVVPTNAEVISTIADLLEAFQVTPADVTAGSNFEDLGLDSLDMVELSVKVEDAYGVEIEEQDLSEVKTVGDAASLVLAKLSS